MPERDRNRSKADRRGEYKYRGIPRSDRKGTY
jgi:hypothetical protein